MDLRKFHDFEKIYHEFEKRMKKEKQKSKTKKKNHTKLVLKKKTRENRFQKTDGTLQKVPKTGEKKKLHGVAEQAPHGYGADEKRRVKWAEPKVELGCENTSKWRLKALNRVY